MSVESIDDMAIGHPLIDADHKQIRSMLERLHEAVATGQDRNVIGKMLADLNAFSIGHFDREEQLMLDHNYSGYSVHKWAHDSFLNELANLTMRSNIGEIDISTTTAEFLARWILDHIKGMDHELASLPAKPAVPTAPTAQNTHP